jgi:hypothetical protein
VIVVLAFEIISISLSQATVFEDEDEDEYEDDLDKSDLLKKINDISHQSSVFCFSDT